MNYRVTFALVALIGLSVLAATGFGWYVSSAGSRRSTLKMSVLVAAPVGGEGTVGVLVSSGWSQDTRPVPGATLTLEAAGSANSGSRPLKMQSITNRDGFARFKIPPGYSNATLSARSRWYAASQSVNLTEPGGNFGAPPVQRPMMNPPASGAAGPPPSLFVVETDKATYLPQQTVRFRAVAIGPDGAVLPKADLHFEVKDPAGNTLMTKTVAADSWGVAAAEFPLADTPPVGGYTLNAALASNTALRGSAEFHVQTKPREVFDLRVQTDAESYRSGDTVAGVVQARYFFGKPLMSAPVRLAYTLLRGGSPQSESLSGQTNRRGEWNFSIPLTGGASLSGSLSMNVTVTDPGTGRSRAAALSLPVRPQTPALYLFPEEGTLSSNPGYLRVYAFLGVPRAEARGHGLRATLTGSAPGLPVDVKNIAENVFELSVPVKGLNSNDYSQTYLEVTASVGGQNVTQRKSLYDLFSSTSPVSVHGDRAVYPAGSRALITTTWARSYPLGMIVTQTGAGTEMFPVRAKDGRADTFVTFPKAGDRAYLVGFPIPVAAAATDNGGMPLYGAQQVLLDGRGGLEVKLNSPDRGFRPGEEVPVSLQAGTGFWGTPADLGLAVVDTKAGGTVKLTSGLSRVLGQVQRAAPEFPFDLYFVGLNEETAQRLASILYYGTHRTSGQGVIFMPVLPYDAYFYWMGVPAPVATLLVVALSVLLALAFAQVAAANALIARRPVLRPISGATEAQIKALAAVNTFPLLFLGLLAPLNALCFLLLLSSASSLLGKAPAGDYLRKHLWTGLAHLAFGAYIAFLFFASPRFTGGMLLPFFIYYAFFLYLLGTLYVHPFKALALDWTYRVVGWGVLALFIGFIILISMPNYIKAKDRAMMFSEGPMADRVQGGEGLDRASGAPAAGGYDERAMAIGKGFDTGLIRGFYMASGTNNSFGSPFGPIGMEGEAPPYHPPAIRKEFPETLLWIPSLETNFRGQASFKIPLAHNITTWEALVVAHDRKGRFGRVTGQIRAFQDFFVDAELPSPVYEGDEFDVPVTVFNYTHDEQKVALAVEKTDGLKVQPAGNGSSPDGSVGVTVPPNGQSTLMYRVRALASGLGVLGISGRSGTSQDALEKNTLVLATGLEIPRLVVGKATPDTPLHLTLPKPDIGRLDSATLKLFPTPVAYALDGLDSMLQEPYGCFEQTTTINYPNLMVLRYLKETGRASPEIQKRAEDLLLKGYQRLLTFQGASGGFGLFSGDSPTPSLSALGLHQLVDMKEIMGVGQEPLGKVIAYFRNSQGADGSWRLSGSYAHAGVGYSSTTPPDGLIADTAYIEWALARAGVPSEKAVRFLIENTGAAKFPNTLALLALALDESGRHDAAASVAKTLAGRAQDTPEHRTYWQGGQSFVPGSYGTEIEATALAIVALSHTGVAPELIPSAAEYLVNKRSSFGGWGSTYPTVSALRALAVAGRESDREATVEVFAAGRRINSFKLEPGEVKPVLVDLLESTRGASGNVPLIVTSNVALTAELAYRILAPWEAVPRLNLPPGAFDVGVKYEAMRLKQGDTMFADVTLKRRSEGASSMVMLEVPIPTGFEFAEGGTQDGRSIFAPIVDRYEIRGKKLTLYVSRVSAQPLEFRIPFVSYSAGEVSTGPVRAYEYYDPTTQTLTAPRTLSITPAT